MKLPNKSERLTKAELAAIREALTAKLAGTLSDADGDCPREWYESALEKIQERS
jgi:hypothetical protein